MNSITDYINEIEFASTKIIEAIWGDNERAIQLKKEIEAEAKIVEDEYKRAIAIQTYAEESDDVMLGVGIYWDNYFGKDKEVHHKKEKLTELSQRLIIREFSIISLCGSLLEFAKKGLSIVYGDPKSWPCGRKIGTQCLSEIILQARNQSAHIDEVIKSGKFKNPKIDTCFNSLEKEVNGVFEDYIKRDLGFEIIKMLR